LRLAVSFSFNLEIDTTDLRLAVSFSFNLAREPISIDFKKKITAGSGAKRPQNNLFLELF